MITRISDAVGVLIKPGVTFSTVINLKKGLAVTADYHRISQIVQNLISNASKFTERGEIELKVDELPLTGKQEEEKVNVRITIRDTGIGMSEAVRARLFQPFTQV